jgi:hypothetical protein
MQKLPLWKIGLVVFLILILARFWIVGTAKVLFNTHSSDGDEWAYFTRAKFLTLGLGALAAIATFLVGRGLYGWETGLLAAFLLAANKEFHLRASTIYADTLMVTTFLGAWYFLIRSFEARNHLPESGPATDNNRKRDLFHASRLTPHVPRFTLLLAGLFVGLAYLTKGSAPLLLGAWGVVALLHYRRNILAHWELLIVPLVFLIVVAPLLVYNVRVFGGPFYNFATTHVMWMERWAESQVDDLSDLPTFSTYMQTHTPADMVARLQKGVQRLNPVLARTLIPSRSWEPPWLGWALLSGAALLGGFLLFFRRRQALAYYRRRRLIWHFSLILFAGFYLFSAWYADVLIESRFLIPILGPFYLLLADLVVSLLRGLKGPGGTVSQTGPGDIWARALHWAYVGAVGGFLVWGSWWLFSTARVESWGLGVDPFASDRQANLEPESILAWLVQERPEDTVNVTFGPSKSLPLWKFPRRIKLERIPVDLDTWPTLQASLQADPPDYIIIDADTARRRRQALGDYFAYQEEGVEIKRIPQGWTLAHLSGQESCRWCIFTLFAEPGTPVWANLAGQIEFLGYDLTYPVADPGSEVADSGSEDRRSDRAEYSLRVILYWQNLADLEQDYTIFLHLTAPDGFVKAQQDRQPFDGLWPTSQWMPGDILATRFDIPLDESIQPGEYLLVTGMYLLETGERLPLIEGPSAPSPNAILVGRVKIGG